MYFKFPVCYPVIHVGDACKDKEACLRMYDIIKCSIVPTEMYQSVLPFLENQKQMLCLRLTCVLTTNTGECSSTTDKKKESLLVGGQ